MCWAAQRPPQGYCITVRHTMVTEVHHYQTHHWRCERCGKLIRRCGSSCPAVCQQPIAGLGQLKQSEAWPCSALLAPASSWS